MAMALTESYTEINSLGENDLFSTFAQIDTEISEIGEVLAAKEEDEKIGDWEFISELLETFRLMNSYLNLKSVLRHVMDAAISVIQAERGFLLMRNVKGEMKFKIARDRAKNTLTDKEFKICQSFLQKAIRSKQIAYVDDTFLDQTFLPSQSMQQLCLRSVVCCPMLAEGNLIGVIYADSSKPIIGHSQIKKQLFQIFANQAAIAIRNAQLYQNVKTSFNKLERAQESLIYAEKMAARGKMAACIGHELNNLLTSIYGNLHLSINSLENQSSIETALERLKLVKNSIEGMERFSNGLMANSHIETKLEQCNLNTLIHEFLEFITPVYKRTGATFEEDFEPNLPDVEIDKGQIQQVLYNLVTNSINAQADTHLSIKTRNLNNEGLVNFCVADTGPGIEKEKLKQIFAPLFTDKTGGHGFGLSICKEIIKKHGGAISVESELGRGTEFTISLPQIVAEKKQKPQPKSLNLFVEAA